MRPLWRRPLLQLPCRSRQEFSADLPWGAPTRESYAIWNFSKKRFATRVLLWNLSMSYRSLFGCVRAPEISGA